MVRLIAVFVDEGQLDPCRTRAQSPNEVPPSRTCAPRNEVSSGTGRTVDDISRRLCIGLLVVILPVTEND